MAYEYDRLEREEGGGSFLMGLLAGTVLGAGLGMLFAPKAGSELRSQLTESAGSLRSKANDFGQQATDKVSQIMDRGREAYDRARSSVTEMASTGTTGSTGSVGAPGNTGNLGNLDRPNTSTPGSTSTSGGAY
jgi:gas vesicle protein